MFRVFCTSTWQKVTLLEEGVDGVEVLVVALRGFQELLSRNAFNPATSSVPNGREDVTFGQEDFTNFFRGVFQPEKKFINVKLYQTISLYVKNFMIYHS